MNLRGDAQLAVHAARLEGEVFPGAELKLPANAYLRVNTLNSAAYKAHEAEVAMSIQPVGQFSVAERAMGALATETSTEQIQPNNEHLDGMERAMGGIATTKTPVAAEAPKVDFSAMSQTEREAAAWENVVAAYERS